MSEVSNKDLLDVLLEMKGDVGEIKANVAAQAKAFAAHVEEDKKLTGNVDELRLSAAKQAGATRVWGILAAAGGSLFGSVVAYFAKH